MSVRPIVLLGDPRLRLKGEPVDSFGRFLHGLLDDLTDTMRHAPGVGLAAPQLGEPLQACVIEVGDQLYELVNPRIVRTAGDDRDLEGCLSLPGYYAYVTRSEKVWVVAQNRHGKKVKVAGSGLLGRALQHELDHLDGKLFIDYLDSMDELIPVGPRATRTTTARHPTTGKAAARPRVTDRRGPPADGDRVRTVFLGSGRVRPADPRPPRRPPVDRPRRASSPPAAARSAGARSRRRPRSRRGARARPRRPDAGGCATRPRSRTSSALEPDLIVLADYGQIVPPALLDLPARRAQPAPVAPAAAPRRDADPGRDPRRRRRDRRDA